MTRPVKFLIIFFLFGSIPWGCTTMNTPVPKINYYILGYDLPTMDLPKKLPCILRMEWFQVVPLYNSNNIIYGENKFIRNAYHYHKWRSNPGDMVTSFLMRDLQAAGLCNAVFMQSAAASHTHTLQGLVDEFYEKDTKDVRQAILSLDITLINTAEPDITRRILMQKRFHAVETCREKSPIALAEAMSRAMSKISGLIIQDIYKHLAKEL